jgi:hypothetical protein
MPSTRDLVAVLSGTEPEQVKGYMLIVDDGTRQATVVSNLERNDMISTLVSVLQILATGEEVPET